MKSGPRNAMIAKVSNVKLKTALEIVISAITVVYFFLVIMWLCPSSELTTRIVAPIKFFWLFWGLEQNWKLFSPLIRNINYHTSATITFQDGTETVWEPPRMEKLSLIDKFRLEKFRKWSVDSLPWPDYKEFWPDFARYVGRKYYVAQNPPVSLSLILHWIEIPLPEKNVARDSLPEHTKTSTVFFYRYRNQDFQ